jgi:uncharacterized protein YbcV (DUF1398 family)
VRRRAWSTPLEKAVGSLDAERVKAYAQASLAGTMPFPQIVEGLLREGVEYYLVDYPQRTFTFYGERGGAVVVPLTIPGLPDVAQDFDAPALQAAILDSQQHGQKYAAFCERAVKAGCQSYFAFLRGKRVLYMGRQGEQHVEWFPGAKPATP